MPFLSKSNIVTGQTIQASQVVQIIDALTASGSYDVLITGSVAIGTGSLAPNLKLYVVGDVAFKGGVSGSSFTGSFLGNGAGITGVPSSSYSLNADNAPRYLPTASYLTDSASFDSRIRTVTGSSIDTSSFVRTSSFNTHVATFNTFTGSYTNDSASFDSRIAGISTDKIKSGNNGLLVVNGNNITATGSAAVTFSISGSLTTSQTITSTGFVQSSLRALKTNINPFTGSAIGILNSTNVVEYVYKKNTADQKVGFIADDTHPLLSGKERNHMDTGNSIGILIKAVQELSKEIEELKKKQ